MKTFIERLKKALKAFWMWLTGRVKGNCPECKKEVYFYWEKAWVLDPEEPPMFGHFICPECEWRSDILPTGLTTDVLEKEFGMTWEEFAEKVAEKMNER